MTYKPLISGQNIKTINNSSLLGSGNLIVASNVDYTELWLKFNGANNSTDFVDDSKNNCLVARTGAVISTNQSKFEGSSAFFNGGTNSVFCYNSNLDVCNLYASSTVEFWTYLTSFNSNQTVIHLNNNGGTQGFQISYQNQKINVDNGVTGTVQSADVLQLNQWQHIAITIIPNKSIYIYVNGSLIHTLLAQSSYQRANLLLIGQYNGGGYTSNFNGYIDNFRISSNAVYTPTLYPNGFTLPDANFNVTAL
ncbi:MAG TPA: LamG domain-containing protein [Allocoleopsis sp.]